MFNNIVFTPFINTGNRPKNEVKTSFLYVNDYHAQISKLEHLKTASDVFDASYKGQNVDTFKVSAGDMNAGMELEKNNLVTKYLNLIGLDVSTLGNHEFDAREQGLNNVLNNAKFQYVCSNIDMDDDDKTISQKKIAEYVIKEKNGNKYGFIGATPIELKEKLYNSKSFANLEVDDFTETIEEINETARELKKQGISRIVLLSHLGLDKDIVLAKKSSGIDVIIGGHTHNLVDGVKEGFNLQTSAANEPVIITQAGKDGQYYGILEVVFDELGRIKHASNKVHKTAEKPANLVAKYFEDATLGKANPIGILDNSYSVENILIQENPIANFLTDALIVKSNADIAFVNSGTIRGDLSQGII
ncbi:MAG: metallophosphoesterase, partial [Candidatus Gastranaerophilales bacterium]|nr:metallophosphoesterase [Candidatus Gastranaerophilales bacterium]